MEIVTGERERGWYKAMKCKRKLETVSCDHRPQSQWEERRRAYIKESCCCCSWRVMGWWYKGDVEARRRTNVGLELEAYCMTDRMHNKTIWVWNWEREIATDDITSSA